MKWIARGNVPCVMRIPAGDIRGIWYLDDGMAKYRFTGKDEPEYEIGNSWLYVVDADVLPEHFIALGEINDS